jgi:hypothetical protein
MFLLDDLLSLPLSGLKFVFRTLRQVAEEQYTDTGPIKERLLELQLQLESNRVYSRWAGIASTNRAFPAATPPVPVCDFRSREARE